MTCWMPDSTVSIKIENGKRQYYDIPTKSYKVVPGAEVFTILENLSNNIVWKNAGANIIDLGDGILNVEFRSKMNTFGQEVSEALNKGIALAGERLPGAGGWQRLNRCVLGGGQPGYAVHVCRGAGVRRGKPDDCPIPETDYPSAVFGHSGGGSPAHAHAGGRLRSCAARRPGGCSRRKLHWSGGSGRWPDSGGWWYEGDGRPCFRPLPVRRPGAEYPAKRVHEHCHRQGIGRQRRKPAK